VINHLQGGSSPRSRWRMGRLLPRNPGSVAPIRTSMHEVPEVEQGSSGNTESLCIAQAIAVLLRDGAAMQLLQHVAARHARLRSGALQARELIADVIEDMIAGRIACDEHKIGARLKGEVRRRAKRVRRAATQALEIPLDDAPAGALIDETAWMAGSAEVEPTRDAAAVVRIIRELAREDGPVLQLMDLHQRLGQFRRRDARSVGMTPAVYRAARERLGAYCAQAVAATQPPRAPSQDEPITVSATLTVAPSHRTERAARSAAFPRTLRSA
jgi:hypothetical protein